MVEKILAIYISIFLHRKSHEIYKNQEKWGEKGEEEIIKEITERKFSELNIETYVFSLSAHLVIKKVDF